MITKDAIEKIAQLAKFDLEEKDIYSFQTQLTNIMEMINSLTDINCEGVRPLTSVCHIGQRMREDLITEGDSREELFANISGKNAGMAKEINCFIVPKVVE
jgi:aspartyl-tRNA(Asn)/glutamyl-tRNA(Gln) amidotransferase subunit C